MRELYFDHDVLLRDGGFIEAACELGGVDGVDVGEKLSRLAGLIRLEMADQVEAGVWKVADQRVFAFELLDVVFPKVAEAKRVRLKDDVGGEHFGDGQKQHFFAFAAGALAGEDEAIFNFGETID